MTRCASAALVALVLCGGIGTASAQSDERAIEPRALAAALAHYGRVEPKVDEVVAAAVREGVTDLERVDALGNRARLSGLLPSIRVGAQRGTGWDLSERLDESGRIQLATDDSLSIRGEAVFALDRLLFARQEVPLLREERAVRLVRQDLVRTVVRIYYERRRLMLERDLLGVNDLEHVIRIEEATALLNAFTGGALSRMISDR